MQDLYRRLYDLAERLGRLERVDRALTGAGTAFPSSPDTNTRFFRTDLGFECYYDGTRWLTAHEYQADFQQYELAPPYSAVSDPLMFAVPGDYNSLYVTRAHARLLVNTTNNGSNYWSVELRQEGSSIWSFNTSADAAATALLKTQNINAAYSPATHFSWRLASKTGAPGSIYIVGSFRFRFVVS